MQIICIITLTLKQTNIYTNFLWCELSLSWYDLRLILLVYFLQILVSQNFTKSMIKREKRAVNNLFHDTTVVCLCVWLSNLSAFFDDFLTLLLKCERLVKCLIYCRFSTCATRRERKSRSCVRRVCGSTCPAASACIGPRCRVPNTAEASYTKYSSRSSWKETPWI